MVWIFLVTPLFVHRYGTRAPPCPLSNNHHTSRPMSGQASGSRAQVPTEARVKIVHHTSGEVIGYVQSIVVPTYCLPEDAPTNALTVEFPIKEPESKLLKIVVRGSIEGTTRLTHRRKDTIMLAGRPHTWLCAHTSHRRTCSL